MNLNSVGLEAKLRGRRDSVTVQVKKKQNDFHKESEMNPYISVTIMIIASIIIGYYLTMTILLSKNKTNNLNKVYQSLLMGFWMGLVEIFMFMVLMKRYDKYYVILTIFLLLGVIILTYLVVTQTFINEKQYLLSMIEHHQMAVDMSDKLKANQEITPEVESLVDEIIKTQKDEIDQMYDFLDRFNR